MSEWLKVVILGVVEGLTEFLPISSTGHLIVVSTLLNFQDGLRDTLNICIQIGAVFAVLAFYKDDLLWQFRHVRADARVRQLWLAIIIAFLPFAIIGLITREWIKENLFSPGVVAGSLILGGILLIAVETVRRNRGSDANGQAAAHRHITPITLRQAALVGLSQLIALIPGVSRSAASIVGGMAAGMSRTAATEFSFLLSMPTLGGAATFELLSSLETIRPSDIGYLVVGSVISAVVAWVAVRWLLHYVSRNSFMPFGYYRIAAGILVLVLVATQVLPWGAG